MRTTHRIFFLLCLCLFTVNLPAQKGKKAGKGQEEKAAKMDKSCKLLNEGIEAFKAKDVPAAIKAWEEAMAQGKGADCYGRAFYNMAFAYMELGDLAQARVWFQKVLDSDLNDVESTGDIMEPYTNYHHNACMKWSRIEWRENNHAESLRLLRMAEREYDMEIFSATTYEKRLVSIARLKSAVYLDWNKPDSALMVILEKALDYDWGYKGDFSSFTNVDFYSKMLSEVDSLAEARFGKEKLREALILAVDKVRAAPAKSFWTGKDYLAGELDLMGMTLHFGAAKEDASLETLQKIVRNSALWQWLGGPEDGDIENDDDD